MTVALLISHGQPSDPAPAEAELAALAIQVAAHLPGWHVGSATLAAPGALAQAVAKTGPSGRAYPLFMAGGWFTRVQLPARLAQAQGAGWQVLEPLGCDPALHALAARIIAESRAQNAILAAHGSHRSPVPAAVATHVAAEISLQTGCPVTAAFIDQTPRIDTESNHGPMSVCLPFFAASGDHVTRDIPVALDKAGFQGRILSAIGLHPDIPELIARAISAGAAACTHCKWQAPKNSDN